MARKPKAFTHPSYAESMIVRGNRVGISIAQFDSDKAFAKAVRAEERRRGIEIVRAPQQDQTDGTQLGVGPVTPLKDDGEAAPVQVDHDAD